MKPIHRAESREPRAESRFEGGEPGEPRAESREPSPAESREPRAVESREPRAESREPRAESREPRAESREFIPPAAVHHAPAERSSYHPPGCTMSASRTAGPVRPPEPSRHPRGASARQDRPAPPPFDRGAPPSPNPASPAASAPRPAPPPFDRGAPPSPNPASPAASAPRPAPLLRRTSLRRRFRPWENAVALLCSISDAIARRATVALPRGTAGAACLIALAWLASPGAQAQTQTETTFISNIGRSND